MKRFIITIILLLSGYGLGYWIGNLGFNPGELVPLNASFGEVSLTVTIFLLLCLLSFASAIILHEFGHLIGGLLSGYEFISFRIGSLTLVHTTDGFKFKRYVIPGTLGQCLMMPSDPATKENFKFILYNVSGGLCNILLAFLSLGLYFMVDQMYIQAFLLINTLVYFVVGITNLVPFSETIPNDGKNLLSLLKHQKVRFAFYHLLKMTGLQYKGTILSEMPDDYFELELTDDDYSQALLMNLKANTILRLYEQNRFEDALSLQEDLMLHVDKFVPFLRFIVKRELIFTKIILNHELIDMDTIYDKEFKQFIQATRSVLDTARFQYAYLLATHDIEAANKQLQHFNQLLIDSPSCAEAQAETELITKLQQHFNIV